MRLLLLLLIFSITLFAKNLYTFTNVSINYLDWTNETENKTLNGDFAYVGFEGGAGWDWGELYGFAYIENPTKKYNSQGSDNLRSSSYVDFDLNVKEGFRVHVQDYYLQGKPYYVNDFVIAVAYKYVTDFGLWIRPALGVHYTNDTYYDGFNGYMAEWLLNYDFKAFGESFSLFQWNEIEFGRQKSFYLANDGSRIGDGAAWGLNGALSLWWNSTTAFGTGIQYRYAQHKLGNYAYQSALIYTLKYNF